MQRNDIEQGDTESAQRTLSAEQIEAFYHDAFVADQVRHFAELVRHKPPAGGLVVDVGGGCGFFAESLAREQGVRVRVLDADPTSVQACTERSVEATQGDALAPAITGDEDIVCFNLILHHLVGASSRETYQLQSRALAAWRRQARELFVNEYIYESYVGNLSGALIYAITSSRILSAIGRVAGKFIPAFRANTFGVGVRFRAHDEWVRLFRAAGFEVVGRTLGLDERVAPALRLLLIRHIRRDSFLLRPIQGSEGKHA
jgi:SAM-dependent methyltransferase